MDGDETVQLVSTSRVLPAGMDTLAVESPHRVRSCPSLVGGRARKRARQAHQAVALVLRMQGQRPGKYGGEATTSSGG